MCAASESVHVYGRRCAETKMVTYHEGEAVLVDEMLSSSRSGCLNLTSLPENFSVANGPQLQNLVLADKLWFGTLLR